jgi:hypothetical protein
MSRAILVTTLALALGACVSEYQSARVVPAGHTAVSAAVTNVRTTDGDMPLDESIDVVDLQVRQGVGAQTELTVRYNDASRINTVLIGAKRSLVTDRLAVALAGGPSWADGDDATVLMPSVLWSVPASPNLEVTGAAKLVMLLAEGERETYPGLDLGLRLSTDLSAWAFQPSLGFLRVEDSSFVSFGAALSFTR